MPRRDPAAQPSRSEQPLRALPQHPPQRGQPEPFQPLPHQSVLRPSDQARQYPSPGRPAAVFGSSGPPPPRAPRAQPPVSPGSGSSAFTFRVLGLVPPDAVLASRPDSGQLAPFRLLLHQSVLSEQHLRSRDTTLRHLLAPDPPLSGASRARSPTSPDCGSRAVTVRVLGPVRVPPGAVLAARPDSGRHPTSCK